MSKEKVVFDTNVLLDNPIVLERTDIDITIPYTVLAELDKLKRNQELSFPAREAIKIIKARFQKGELSIVGVPQGADTNDEKIVLAAKDADCALYTNDIGASVVGLSQGVSLFKDNAEDSYDKDYIGYYEVKCNAKVYYTVLNMNNTLQHAEIETLVSNEYPINAYVICTPDDGSANSRIFRKDEACYTLIPDGAKAFRGVSTDRRHLNFGFLHPEQAIAFDAVFNDKTPLAVVYGRVGAGKSLLSTLAAIARTDGTKANKLYDKVLVTRPNLPINKKYELGFRPGSENEKMLTWLVGFTSNLEFLFNHTKADVEDNVGMQVFNELFQPIAIESIQGMSVNKKIMIVDEAQLLDSDTLQQIMLRVASGSKLVLLLDPAQAYGANRGNEGYKKLLPYLKGSKYISFVSLQHIQRGELTRFVDSIFNKKDS